MTVNLMIAAIVLLSAIVLFRNRRGDTEMPQGLQVSDARNNIIYETGTNMTRFIARRELFGSGTLTLEELGYSGTSLFVIMVTSPYYKANYTDPPDITITMTNTSLTWVNVPNNRTDGVPATVLLGVY